MRVVCSTGSWCPVGAATTTHLVVPAGSTARTLADLKGKRIALHRGRPWEITFARLVAEQGLKLSDFRIANLNPGAGAAAIAAGDVDASSP
jgi:sulfonate transport system substrate-binding protein